MAESRTQDTPDPGSGGDPVGILQVLTGLAGREIPLDQQEKVAAALGDLASAMALLPVVGEIALPQPPFDPRWDPAGNDR